MTLVEKRVTRAIRELRLVGNLANRHNYRYNDRDARKIVTTLEAELKLLKAKFMSHEIKKSNLTFKL